jgi:transposase-like protein
MKESKIFLEKDKIRAYNLCCMMEAKMEAIKCPNCGSTKSEYIKYNFQWDASEYYCDNCKKTILDPGSTWD